MTDRPRSATVPAMSDAERIQADQIATTVAALLEPRLGAIEKSLRGDDFGNPGLARRVHAVEETHRGVDKVHADMRTAADSAVDRLAEHVRVKADRQEVEDLSGQVQRLSTRIDRLIWLFLGAGIASGGGAAAIAQLLGS